MKNNTLICVPCNYPLTLIGVVIVLFILIFLLIQTIEKGKEGWEKQARAYFYSSLVTIWMYLFLKGHTIITNDDYYKHIMVELSFLIITVGVIDVINERIKLKKEKFFNDMALRRLRLPLRRHIIFWLMLYESNNSNRIQFMSSGQYISLRQFFMSSSEQNTATSREFIDVIKRLNLSTASTQGAIRSKAQFLSEHYEKNREEFDQVLAKYGTKLSYNLCEKVEKFVGESNMSKVFAFIQAASSAPIRTLHGFQDIDVESFRAYFANLFDLVDAYNEVAKGESNRILLSNINDLSTLRNLNQDKQGW
jgi:hypothetical protein